MIDVVYKISILMFEINILNYVFIMMMMMMIKQVSPRFISNFTRRVKKPSKGNMREKTYILFFEK